MPELDVVTSADRRDLGEQVSAAFRPLWPEFAFHDPVAAGHIDRERDRGTYAETSLWVRHA